MDPKEKEAAERGYVVVKFLDDESVSEVPKLWIIEESGVQTQCQWPSHANNVSNLIAKYATPTPRWQKFNVDIIKDKCSSLKSARSAAADSDYNTTDDDNLGKRNRNAISIIVNSTDDEGKMIPPKKKPKKVSAKTPGKKLLNSTTKDCPDFYASKQTPTVISVERVEVGQFDLTIRTNSFALEQAREPSVAAQGNSSPNSYDTDILDKNGSPEPNDLTNLVATTGSTKDNLDQGKIENNNTWQSDFNHLNSDTPVVIAEYDCSVHDGTLADENDRPTSIIHDEVILDKSVDQDLLDIAERCEKQFLENIRPITAKVKAPPMSMQPSHVVAGNTSQQYDLLSKPSPTIKDYFDRILQFQASISINIRSIDSRLKALESMKRTEPRKSDTVDVTREFLPLLTIQDVKNFEDLVTKSKDAAEAFKRRVERIGGNSPRDFVQRALSLTFTNGCAVGCSWKGFKNLFGVFKLQLTKIIINAVFEKYVDYTEADFGVVATEWFSFAGQRRRRELRASSA